MKLLDVLACPYCKVGLKQENDLLICPVCLNPYPVKNTVRHLYNSDLPHWKKIMVVNTEIARRFPEQPQMKYEDNTWLDRVVENTPLSQRANKVMFNVAIDFFGDDLYKEEYGLEFGCAQGWSVIYLSQYKPMIGLDISNFYGLEEIPNINKGIEKVIADGHYMPFLDNSIGIVFSCAALHHIHDRAMGVREIYRILKPGGKYCGFGDLWTNEQSMREYWSDPDRKTEENPYGWDSMIEGRPYSKDELYRWFDIGFSKVHIQPIVYKPHMHEFGYLNIACGEEGMSNLIIMVTK